MDLVSILANPAPEGAVVGRIQSADGVGLRFARWPGLGPRRGTVCLLQGRAEFIEKYFEVIGELRQRGFAVAALDWRGQGLSDRALRDIRKGHVDDFTAYESDLTAFMQQVALPDCPPPYFALAHSVGAAVLLNVAHRGRRWFERSVLSAPMIGLAGRAMSRGARLTARVMRLSGFGAGYVPGGGATATNSLPFIGNVLTSDPERYARTGAVLDANPRLGLGSPTIAWLGAAYRVMDAFADPSFPSALRHPMLLVAAGNDEVVSTTSTEQFAIRTRAGAHLIIAGARHEILMEQDRFRAQFWAAFDAFVPGTSSD